MIYNFLLVDMRMEANAEYRRTAMLAPQECGGCGKFITDRYLMWNIIISIQESKFVRNRYLLRALDLYWHEDCLKCGCCDCRLSENGSTLYTRANLVLCRRDYLRYLAFILIKKPLNGINLDRWFPRLVDVKYSKGRWVKTTKENHSSCSYRADDIADEGVGRLPCHNIHPDF